MLVIAGFGRDDCTARERVEAGTGRAGTRPRSISACVHTVGVVDNELLSDFLLCEANYKTFY